MTFTPGQSGLILQGIRLLLQVGVSGATEKNILTDPRYNKMFLAYLRDQLGQGMDSDVHALMRLIDPNVFLVCSGEMISAQEHLQSEVLSLMWRYARESKVTVVEAIQAAHRAIERITQVTIDSNPTNNQMTPEQIDEVRLLRYRYHIMLGEPTISDTHYDFFEEKFGRYYPHNHTFNTPGSDKPEDYPAFIRDRRRPTQAEFDQYKSNQQPNE